MRQGPAGHRGVGYRFGGVKMSLRVGAVDAAGGTITETPINTWQTQGILYCKIVCNTNTMRQSG